MADRRGRLSIRIAQALLVGGAAGLWAASRLPWVDLRTFDGLGPPKVVVLSGAAWSSALLPLTLVLLATAVAALAVRGWPLRMLAVLVAVVSLATGYLAISMWAAPDVAVRAADLTHVPVLTLVGSQRHYMGPAITLATAVCALVGAVLLMRAANLARGTVTKYAASTARRSGARRSEHAMSERMIWDALDDGLDPTQDPTQDSTDQPQESAAPPNQDPRHEADSEGR
ncbi:MAG: TIGR02234 family membrane protein [Mycobacterium sp.]|nr:TIGR02234 family membrane protein [Mycobacterium sp.]MBV9720707.1 TIGR02234 family membrane protein [Mycobacterium sp.]